MKFLEFIFNIPDLWDLWVKPNKTSKISMIFIIVWQSLEILSLGKQRVSGSAKKRT
jgi:hypothetical protein